MKEQSASAKAEDDEAARIRRVRDWRERMRLESYRQPAEANRSRLRAELSGPTTAQAPPRAG